MRRFGGLAAVVLVLLAVGCTEPAGKLSITVEPAESALDAPFRTRVTGLAGGERVTVTASTVDPGGRRWQSTATFVADRAGVVDLDTAPPQDAAYTEPDGTGPVWSMRPPGNDEAYLPLVEGYDVELVARAGGRSATTTLRRRQAADWGRATHLRVPDDGVRGVYLPPAGVPAGSGPRPAVLVFGGSEGGVAGGAVMALMFASHGYPALGLAYFGDQGLPGSLANVTLEYFVRALDWLRRQPGVDPDRIWVAGASRGGEAALLLAAHFPDRVYGAISYAGANVAVCGHPDCAKPAWTLRGRAVPFTRQFNQPEPSDEPAAQIPVESIRGPVLLACGGSDIVWAACRYLGAADARLTERRPGRHRALSYPDAGHGVASPIPYQPRGGTPDPHLQGTQRARVDLWRATLDMLGR